MGAALGALGIGLCVVFGGFIVVLLVEVYYIFYCRQKRELHGNTLSSRGRSRCLLLNENQVSEFLGLACWRRRLKNGINYLVSRDHQQHHSHNNNNNNVTSVSGNNSNQQQQSTNAIVQMDACFGELQAASSSSMHSEFVARLFPLQADLTGDPDILHLQALLGPPRLLFTINEETKEDLESEEAKSKTGRSRGESRASSEFFPQLDSGSITPLETPFVTPPSSPPFTSPAASPLHPQEAGAGAAAAAAAAAVAVVVAEEAAAAQLLKPLNIFMDESSSSFSSSSSENITPPIPSSPPSRKPLSTLMEETSSSSSSSAATPFALSPPLPSRSPKRGRSSLGAFLDVPSQNRIYPLEAPPAFKPAASPPIRDHHQFPRGNLLLRNHLEGVPVLGVSPSNGFSATKIEGLDFPLTASPPRQFQHSGDFSSTPSPSWPPSPPAWPPSPPTPPLRSALSSPLFTSPTLGPIDASSPFHVAY